MPPPQKGSAAQGSLAAVGIAALAVVCCAALPVLAALAGGVAIGAVLGVGAGILVAVALIGLALARARRRRDCKVPDPGDGRQPDGALRQSLPREEMR